jgi:hypothetical protein
LYFIFIKLNISLQDSSKEIDRSVKVAEKLRIVRIGEIYSFEPKTTLLVEPVSFSVKSLALLPYEIYP